MYEIIAIHCNYAWAYPGEENSSVSIVTHQVCRIPRTALDRVTQFINSGDALFCSSRARKRLQSTSFVGPGGGGGRPHHLDHQANTLLHIKLALVPHEVVQKNKLSRSVNISL